ncbi:2-dehydropantoate 2-reductase [Synchytrium endobioticum]|uniref:2-dehydropantoate 2-reductase n=1 Tax=Synchytrium endobioticum TaxID=286115 RepID=A0A507DLQ8_9FUNG|nr:2-dehydropantoate 2-reductase [Synchytrium endobioticum]TPX52592.1 2-dehydropantoate 2-reductase [Synchytrium endobioticum]
MPALSTLLKGNAAVGPSAQPKVCILGAGLVGCWIGAMIAARGKAEVHFVGRQALLDRITTAGGLGVSCMDGRTHKIPLEGVNFHLAMPADVVFDYIVLTTKRTGTKDALKALTHLDTPASRTVLVTLQNGVRQLEDVRDVLAHVVVVTGMFPFNVVQSDATFCQSFPGKIVMDSTTAQGRAFIALLRASRVLVLAERNMQAVLYAKLLANLNNPISALSAMPLKAELEDQGYRLIYVKMLREALAVYKKAGISPKSLKGPSPHLAVRIYALPDNYFAKLFPFMMKIDPKATSSMYEDIKANRQTEIEYLNGEIIRLAKSVNVSVPYNERVYKLVKLVELAKSSLVKHTPVQIEDYVQAHIERQSSPEQQE